MISYVIIFLYFTQPSISENFFKMNELPNDPNIKLLAMITLQMEINKFDMLNHSYKRRYDEYNREA